MFVFWRIFPTSVFFKWLHLFLRLLSFLFLALFVSIIFYPCEGIGIFLSIYSIISLYQCIKSFIYISIITWFVIQYYLICCSNFSSFGSWELFQFSPVFLPLLILFVCVCVCVCVCSSFLHFFHYKMLQTHLWNYLSPKISIPPRNSGFFYLENIIRN